MIEEGGYGFLPEEWERKRDIRQKRKNEFEFFKPAVRQQKIWLEHEKYLPACRTGRLFEFRESIPKSPLGRESKQGGGGKKPETKDFEKNGGFHETKKQEKLPSTP